MVELTISDELRKEIRKTNGLLLQSDFKIAEGLCEGFTDEDRCRNQTDLVQEKADEDLKCLWTMRGQDIIRGNLKKSKIRPKRGCYAGVEEPGKIQVIMDKKK
jgi:hypothetical protein